MTNTSGASPASSFTQRSAFASSGWVRARPRSRATRATAGEASERPRPAGRSGCARTQAMSNRASANASSERAANSGVPRKTMRNGMASVATRLGRGGREVGVALLDRLQLLLQALAAQDAQAIDEQHSVQVIHFVLHGAREEAFAGERDCLALLAHGAHVHLGRALEPVVHAGDGEATLVVVLAAGGVLVLGIDEGDVHHLLAALGDAEHGDAQA